MKPMNRLITLFFLSFLCNLTFAQDRDLVEEMTGNYIQIRQKSGSETMLKEWLANLPLEEDTIYAILYVPMDCPRCEAAIPNFQELLKDVDEKQKFVLITAYRDSLLAKEYNQRNNYLADAYLYDTTEHYQQILNTNMSGGLMGAHILKIDRKNGNLLVGGQYTLLNTLFVKQLIGFQGMMMKESFNSDYQDDATDYTKVPKDIPLLREYDDYLIDSISKVSTLFDSPRFVGDKLFFTDVLNNGVMLYTQQENLMKYEGLLQIDSTEKKRFLHVSDEDYRHFVKHHLLYYIALGTNLLDDNHIGISYSIPKVIKNEQDNSYGMYNAPVIISRRIDSMRPDSMVTLNFDLENDTLFFNTHFSFCRHKDDILMGCKKLTWPMEYEKEEYAHIPSKNPFSKEFYRSSNPYISVFDYNTGTLRKRYGLLGSPQEKSLTGYYFTQPIASSYNNELIYTDGYSGEVVIVDGENQESVYQVYPIDTTSFPSPDTTMFYTYEYVRPYTKFFNRRISDIRFDKKHIYCIIKYAQPDSDEGARYGYTIINRKSRKCKQHIIPQTTGQVLGCGLRLKKGKVAPFIISKEASGTHVIVFRK